MKRRVLFTFLVIFVLMFVTTMPASAQRRVGPDDVPFGQTIPRIVEDDSYQASRIVTGTLTIPADQVTVNLLKQMFALSAYTVTDSRDDSNLFGIFSPDRIKVAIEFRPNNKLIVFRMLNGLVPGIPRFRRLEAVNKMNVDIIFTRFSIVSGFGSGGEDALCAEYFYSYSAGLSHQQLIELERLFERTIIEAMMRHGQGVFQ